MRVCAVSYPEFQQQLRPGEGDCPEGLQCAHHQLEGVAAAPARRVRVREQRAHRGHHHLHTKRRARANVCKSVFMHARVCACSLVRACVRAQVCRTRARVHTLATHQLARRHHACRRRAAIQLRSALTAATRCEARVSARVRGAQRRHAVVQAVHERLDDGGVEEVPACRASVRGGKGGQAALVARARVCASACVQCVCCISLPQARVHLLALE